MITKTPNYTSVNSFGPAIHQGNNNLIISKIPKNILSLPQGCFNICSGLKYIDIQNIEELPYRALCKNTSLEYVKSSKLIKVDEGALSYCSSLKKVDLSKVVEIGESALYQCTSLKSVDISSLNEIDAHAFGECSKLENIVFSETLNTIGESAFRYCINLRKIALPNSILRIKTYAFGYCSKLSNINLPEVDHNVAIEILAFLNSNLSSEFYLPNNYILEGDSNGPFLGTKISKYKVSETNLTYMTIDGILYSRKSEDSQSSDFNVPIYLQAMPPLYYKSVITIPASVTGTRRYELSNAKNLSYIQVEQGNSTYSSKNGILYDTSGLGCLIVPEQYEDKSIIIPEGVKTIGGVYSSGHDNAPARVAGYGLISNYTTNITLPKSTKQIAGLAFNTGYSLLSVNSNIDGVFDFSGLTNLMSFGYKSLQYCTKMTTLKIGKCIKDDVEIEIALYDGFILNATNLEYIYLDATIPPSIETGSYTETIAGNFANLTKLKTVYVPKGYGETYKTSTYWSCLADKIVEVEP